MVFIIIIILNYRFDRMIQRYGFDRFVLNFIFEGLKNGLNLFLLLDYFFFFLFLEKDQECSRGKKINFIRNIF